MLHAKDQQNDVRFTYQGMGRLASRSQANTTGQVDEESGFGGLRRKYKRDKAGRVVRVDRPGDRFSEFAYDVAGRVTTVVHSDGSKEAFQYRADGSLMKAVNAGGVVGFERDPVGRVLKEIQGDHWIENTYNALGMRTRVRTSMGLDQRIERNAMGNVTRLADAASGYETTFVRDQMGLEIERSLPGGVHSRWQRDKTGRPLQHTVEARAQHLRSVGYRWEPNDRLRSLIDGLKGPTEHEHDGLGNLTSVRYADGTVDLRMPDAVGNLFRTAERGDREYGPSGQLLVSRTAQGTIQYRYDEEGNLVEKVEERGGVWRYTWSASGLLAKVVRPDGGEVAFTYDALGRRLKKMYRGQTTCWVWDGNTPVHEWVVGKLDAQVHADAKPASSADATIKQRQADLLLQLGQGPPSARGTPESPITWLFEPESFSPVAKLLGGNRQSIVTDHLGTPVLMTDSAGHAVWSASISAWGQLRDVQGDRHACPFRWPGQYEDAETGLYYNRFRYYDPDAGQYVSQDPIGLAGGLAFAAYVHDPLAWIDPFGLSGCGGPQPGYAWSCPLKTGHLSSPIVCTPWGIASSSPCEGGCGCSRRAIGAGFRARRRRFAVRADTHSRV